MSPDIPAIFIGARRVAEDMPPFVIAEIGLNHGGSVHQAIALVEAAARAGAHAVKLQTIEAGALVAHDAPAPAHVSATSMVDFFSAFELNEAAHRIVIDRARRCGLAVLSTPFSLDAVDMLERLDIDGYKIASGDLTWDGLVARCAETGKPLVMSTGMATLAEARHAVSVAEMAGAREIALLHCVSAYPVPQGSENLLAIRTLASECRVPVGLSDHGADTFAFPIAVSLGACLYERHIMVNRSDNVVDAAVSSTPAQLQAAMADARRAWLALGSGRKACIAAEAVNRTASRRSLCARRPLRAGDVVRAEDLIALRPGDGYAPRDIAFVCGRRLARAVAQGTPLVEADLEAALNIDLEAHRVA